VSGPGQVVLDRSFVSVSLCGPPFGWRVVIDGGRCHADMRGLLPQDEVFGWRGAAGL